jgi:hypothetical protein
MKEQILICERKVGTLVLRGYRIQEHYLMAAWGLEEEQTEPKLLVFDGFEELNRTWLGFPSLEEEALRRDLSARPTGMQPRVPRIVRNSQRPSTGDRPDRPSRPALDRPSSSDRPYRAGGDFERTGEPNRERPRIERPRRSQTED